MRSKTNHAAVPARCRPRLRARSARGWFLSAAVAALTASGLAFPGGAFPGGASAAAAARFTRGVSAAATARSTTTAAARFTRGVSAAATARSTTTAAARSTAGTRDYRRACAVTMRPGRMACMALIRTGVGRPQAAFGPGAAPVGVGYGPSRLQSAYRLASAAASAGGGQTVAVVDAFNDPNAASDLAVYRSDWGLPGCGAGCFRKVNENGLARPLPAASRHTGWALEQALDLDMVSAICPKCHIILVEASTPDVADLGKGVNSAVRLGARYVSNSYGGPESSSDPAFDTAYYKHAGVAVTASGGDDGYGVSYPAASRYVISVGGTSLRRGASARGWTETAWGSSGSQGTGSGCSADDAKPSWQADAGCARRTDNDVAADADPDTGVAVYDTYDQGGWLEVGGTSASSPLIAAVFALAGTPAAGTYPASYIYQHAARLFDVTSGADGSCGGSYLCTARPGYDGPTGLGTPDGTGAFSGKITGSPDTAASRSVTVTSPGNQKGAVGTG
jgi:hypothetical protein